MESDAKIFLASSTGLVGSTLGRRLIKTGHTNICAPSRAEWGGAMILPNEGIIILTF